MSLKAHIALGTLLGLLLGAGAVAVLSRTATPTDASDPLMEASERDRASDIEESVSPAAVNGLSTASEFRRPMRPGSQRRLLQS